MLVCCSTCRGGRVKLLGAQDVFTKRALWAWEGAKGHFILVTLRKKYCQFTGHDLSTPVLPLSVELGKYFMKPCISGISGISVQLGSVIWPAFL